LVHQKLLYSAKEGKGNCGSFFSKTYGSKSIKGGGGAIIEGHLVKKNSPAPGQRGIDSREREEGWSKDDNIENTRGTIIWSWSWAVG